MTEKPTRVTLVEVAERAGVSLGSASRALHGGGASDVMVERVRAAADELGYRPDASGRSLRMKRTQQIAFAVADIGNPVYVEMLSAIHSALEPHGYRVVVMGTGPTARSSADLIRSLSTGIVDAMIIAPLRTDDALVQEIRDAPVPIVVIGRSLADAGIDSVSTDSAEAIGMAVRHLVGIGRRRIAFVNGPLDTTPGEARQRGFDTATVEGFGAERGEVVVAEDFTVAAGLAATSALLERSRDAGSLPDAVVAANDLLAIGAIRAARRLGLSVPEDLAVTGLDDTEFGRVFQPSITSVSLGTTQRGLAAAELVRELVDPERPAVRTAAQIRVAPELRARESTGAPEPASSEEAR
ncbi:LacI family DNA-binding transcriptional regulator [Microbacterium resistens]|uniref:LacI family DNA-binding transcriptional regulator n=1 Tax=Microbacterium resistens TaxID=156977 RepID=UPI0008312617|nr:LacI family DNA-binding transcriptional regulator [Microbacterium resistens]